MAKTLISGPILRPLIFFCELYLYLPDIVTSYHPMQFTGKLTNQTWENGKKPNKLRAQMWAHKNYFVGFISTSNYKLFQANILCNFQQNQWTKLEKMSKNLILGPILACLA